MTQVSVLHLKETQTGYFDFEKNLIKKELAKCKLFKYIFMLRKEKFKTTASRFQSHPGFRPLPDTSWG